jgi:hypothetical protein
MSTAVWHATFAHWNRKGTLFTNQIIHGMGTQIQNKNKGSNDLIFQEMASKSSNKRIFYWKIYSHPEK